MTIQKFNFVCNLLIYNQGGMWLIINIERRNERYKNITMKRYKNIYDETKRKEQNVTSRFGCQAILKDRRSERRREIIYGIFEIVVNYLKRPTPSLWERRSSQ